MKNLRIPVVAYFLFSFSLLSAQNTEPGRQVDFFFADESQGIRFQPLMPASMQKAGAPAAYYTYFWEFGDGTFSREEQPLHRYEGPGEFTVSLDATAHYDNGKKAKKKKTKVANTHSEALTSVSMPDVFDAKSRQAIAMSSNAKPRAEEELTLVISYRNNSFVTTNGRLHLFFNEKKFKTSHFDFVEARTHFGETADPLISQVLPTHPLPTSAWTALQALPATGVCTSWAVDYISFSIVQDMLDNARSVYRDEKAWRFTELEAGEKRNIFISLAATADMLRDTSAFIHLEAVFAPDDPVVAPERFELEIEIVASHDPNVIAVSDNRVSYRTLGSKKFDYKVQFQNNGEGPASTVELKVEIPEGLDMTRMRPVEWYPECPICPKTPTDRSCLDTASSKNGLTFTFRNIYLPGSHQKGVSDRDSTKGFVKYRIEAGEDMPKFSFRSRAKITFDKNPPIYTNFTKTRFKPGISPGLKAGYHFVPDSAAAGYFFLGASLSPYKSWRLYPQVELLTGIKGQADVPDQLFTQADTFSNPGAFTRVFRTDSLVKAKQGFVSLEVPLLIRKNFTGYFGAGVGGAVQVFFENGDRNISLRKIITTYFPNEPIPAKSDTTLFAPITSSYSDVRSQFTVFADLTFGSVRAGPNLGIRAGAVLGRKKNVQPFVQVSLEMKL